MPHSLLAAPAVRATLLVLLCLAAACKDSPSGPGEDPTPILISSRQGGPSIPPQLQLVSLDGRRTVPLGVVGVYTDWSPDGQRIVYSRLDASLTYSQLFVADADGRNESPLVSPPGSALGPAWSPDGKTIAYWGVSRNGTDVGLMLMQADGTDSHRLSTTTSAIPARFSWSPDGTRLLFANDAETSSLYVIDSAGKTLTHLTPTGRCDDTDPAWSPDGKTIALSRGVGPLCAQRIVLINADGTGERIISEGPRDYMPSWSPDGRRLVFERLADITRDVWVVNADGTGAVNLTPDSPDVDNFQPRWRPRRLR